MAIISIDIPQISLNSILFYKIGIYEHVWEWIPSPLLLFFFFFITPSFYLFLSSSSFFNFIFFSSWLSHSSFALILSGRWPSTTCAPDWKTSKNFVFPTRTKSFICIWLELELYGFSMCPIDFNYRYFLFRYIGIFISLK